ncbi:hypothetical protein EQU24_05165 [Methylotuvimicrobium buryatense]|uniref:Uncharacterized protein n=1 Tax=Methylotuvimicrobium buryatense TaxID=95641 RepID=A0A4V1IJK3_METBY|nr:hypothetical protein EQU24_05165 [Methylotuvimicrobium buryatense]
MALADFCSCKICIHAILGVRAAAKPPWMGLRLSSTGIPHTLKSAKLLKLGIAGTLPDFHFGRFDVVDAGQFAFEFVGDQAGILAAGDDSRGQ